MHENAGTYKGPEDLRGVIHFACQKGLGGGAGAEAESLERGIDFQVASEKLRRESFARKKSGQKITGRQGDKALWQFLGMSEAGKQNFIRWGKAEGEVQEAGRGWL